jgi:hypothetical protein
MPARDLDRCHGRAFVALCTLLVPVAAWAESDEARHGIGLRLGIRGTSVREDLLVPLTFSGAGPDLGASYRGLLGPGRLDVGLEAGASLVANRFGHLGVTFDHALDVGYLLPVGEAGAWRFDAGPVVGENSDSLALESWDDAHGYWLGLGWLGPRGSVAGPIGKGWQLEATADLALLGLAGRPPAYRANKQDPTTRFSFYAWHTFADAQVVGPWDVQHFRFDVAARPSPNSGRVGRGWSFGIQGRFTRADFPKTIIVLESVLYAGWTWGV